jgi:hypothetical protein
LSVFANGRRDVMRDFATAGGEDGDLPMEQPVGASPGRPRRAAPYEGIGVWCGQEGQRCRR